MKKLFFTLAFVLSVAPAFTQNIFIANSNTGAVGGTNVFTGANSINAALVPAVTGDIIYVVPSSVVYNTPSLNGEGVSLIGGGFNPDKSGGALSVLASVIANANNVRLSGLVINQEVNFSGSFSNIMIDKCRVKYLFEGNSQVLGNLIIQNCIVGENHTSSSAFYLQGASSNIKISNNIIYCANTTSAVISGLNAATIENNVFIGFTSGGSASVFNNVTNCNIKNNIFYASTPAGSGTFSGNDLQNNLSYSTSNDIFSTVNGNISSNNVEGQNPLFTDLPFGTTFSFSYNLILQAGSLAIGSGLDGIDMGVFGGANPYDVYGTSLPIVQTITAPNTVTQGTNMNVRIEAKGN
ncbi:MAG: hypothetical protein WD824_19950 [Cyclobacteriaceae bacterium]